MAKTSPPQANISPFLSNIIDRRRNGLYDRVLLKAGVPTPERIVCFQRCVDQFTNWTETNMIYPGSLPAPWETIIQRFLFLFQPGCSDVDVAAFLKSYVWRFSVLEKRYQLEPVLVCAVKGSMADLVEGFGHDACNGTVRPYARPYSFFLGESMIYLPALVSFRLEIEGTPITPGQDLDFYPILDGTNDYPVA